MISGAKGRNYFRRRPMRIWFT